MKTFILLLLVVFVVVGCSHMQAEQSMITFDPDGKIYTLHYIKVSQTNLGNAVNEGFQTDAENGTIEKGPSASQEPSPDLIKAVIQGLKAGGLL